MQGPEAASPAYEDALREELLLTASFLAGHSLLGTQDLLDEASRLTSPWWHMSVDLTNRRLIVRRIANRIRTSMLVNHDALSATAQTYRRLPVLSIEEYWVRSVLTHAAVRDVSFPEAVRLATSDALWQAHVELDGDRSTFPLELAVIYDAMVLTSAYGRLHTLRSPADSRTLKRATQILSHAALIADRAR
jgi:hypothetical protein